MLNLERLQKPTGKNALGFHHTSLIDKSGVSYMEALAGRMGGTA